MLKITGAILLIAGTTGFGIACRNELVQKLAALRYLSSLLEMLRGEICFSKAALPEACRLIGRRAKEPYRETLFAICDKMGENRGVSFDVVWKEEMERCLERLPIDREEKELVLNFFSCSGFADRRMQERAVEQQCGLLQQAVKKQEEAIENKSKVVMSMGLISGIFLTIVLL